ncbi:MAG: flagellar motor switch protein FliM [Nitrospirae bacterium]|nr:flagellar motor switch protein FliM [Nitrospirota bacterium]
MNQILSQDEVDALLKGVQSGDVETETERGKEPSGVRPYDLTSQEQIVRGKMPGLELANAKFVKSFRNSVSNLIMKFVDVNLLGVKFIKFEELMKTIPFPSSINIIKLEPLKGNALLIIEAPLLFALVEIFFGGSKAQYVKSEGRSFTSIEQRVNQKIVAMALNDISLSWNGIVQIKPEHISLEMNPQFVKIVTPNEIVIKIEIQVEIEDFKGNLFFCIPYSMIEPVKERLYSGFQSEKNGIDQRWINTVKEIVMNTCVGVIAEVGKAEITFGDLLNLEIGSVINLGKHTSEEFPIKVEGILKFYGLPGYSRGNQAIKITKVIN